MNSIGFIGGGVMAEAMIRGLLSRGLLEPSQVFVYDADPSRSEWLSIELGLSVMPHASHVCDAVQGAVIIAVKPDVVDSVMNDIRGAVEPERNVIISVAAGISLDRVQQIAKPGTRVVRVMPNTPCLVREGVSCYTLGQNCRAEDGALVQQIFSAIGTVHEVPEKQLDAVTGLTGSGPAYVFMFIEALADGAVLNGLPRSTARTLAAEMVCGAAQMVKANPSVHPAELRNRVESPAGTTISATNALEHGGFRAAVIDAVTAAAEKSRAMGKK
uniref:Pyrroline-5-carboxylate reductase n=1 Tax=Compsopogon caeruleus TaxID=31354 RepID=A0A7S1T9C5_9RHOD|mmetsp:Transcript_1349/g.2799  ORF Transcript_1349/g.2799 Transcript_1349/m.2799 type:complete len:272 (+) Transcript_1349:124-939(+)|eukprot:CAMPEP_0184684164 /NCGR_PEP_ID=MMETSP0312-20130426/14114_1 /TAXON_ID=31354 /ORGANISM="Compsopogon coeruleus, Strain SAG 36.94" /LENGTH=271 /DNA_ID=CAMNT_0027137077 /DNA_START=89 /DNA_END=904 /DNA_ORIENTATION=+